MSTPSATPNVSHRHHVSFPPSGNVRYNINRDVPYSVKSMMQRRNSTLKGNVLCTYSLFTHQCRASASGAGLTSHWRRRWAHPDHILLGCNRHLRPVGHIRAGNRPESQRKGPVHNLLVHSLEKYI